MPLIKRTLLVAAAAIAGLVVVLAVTMVLTQGRPSGPLPLFALAGSCVVVILGAVLLMERFVLSRLRRIERGVAEVTATGDARGRITITGGDEVGTLGGRINEMLASIQRSRHAVEESEARYRSVIEQASEGILLIDMESLRIIEANEAACRLLEYSNEELAVRTLLDLGIGAPSEVREIARRARFERRLQGIDLTAVRRDGSEIEVEMSCSAASLHGQQVLWLLLRDVSIQRRAQASLRRREAILKAVSYAAERFLREGPEAIPNVLERLGMATSASRVYVWENHEAPDGGLLTSQRYEWAAPGITSQQGNPELQGVSYRDGGFERWEGILRAGGEVAGIVAELPEGERRLLLAQSIRSIVMVPVFVGQSWWGFMGFDDCLAARTWSEAEIEGLRAAAGIIGGLIQRQRSIERIAEAEAKYRALVEQIPAAIFIDALDEEGSTLYISPQIEEILGFPPEQWSVDPALWFRQIHPDDVDRVRDANSRHVNELEPFVEEYRIRDRHGTYVWVRDEAVVVQDERGRPRFSQGFLMDVTERRRVEDAVRRQNDYLSAIHETALAMMDRLDLAGLLEDIVSRAASLIGTGHGFVYLPADGGEVMDVKVGVGALADWVGLRIRQGEGASGRAWETGEPVVISDYQSWDGRLHIGLTTSAVVSVPLKSGSEVVGVLGLAHVDSDLTFSEDDVRLLTGFAEFAAIALDNARLYDEAQREIAERKRTQADLEQQEQKYRSLFENAAEGIYRVSLRGVFESANPALARMLGYESPAGLMEELRAVDMLPIDQEDRAARQRLLAETGSIRELEYRARRRDGREIWVSENARPVRDDDHRVVGLEGTVLDITQRRVAEEGLRDAYEREREAAQRLRDVDEMKNAFLSAVSHELRTPLSSILGFALTLERSEVALPADQILEMVGRIAANARKLQRLLTDLLDLDRISRGILEPARRPTDVGDLAHRVVEETDLGGRQVLVEAPSVVMEVDAPKVERIVENLLANAAKYTPEGTPVWVRIEPDEAGMMIAVEDAGPGVPEPVRETIFRPFEQGDDVPTHAPGTGIGLSLVARFAELHGGRAWVEERAGGGASFRVYLPADEVRAPEAEVPAVSDRSGL